MIRFSGTGFGTAALLKIGDMAIPTEEWVDNGEETSLVFETPAGLRPGTVEFCLYIVDFGCALSQERYSIYSKYLDTLMSYHTYS